MEVILDENNTRQPIRYDKVPIELMTIDQLNQLTADNSFVANSQLMGHWFQKDICFANKRAVDYEKLHDHLFDPLTQKDLDEKSLITLYGIAIGDINKRTSQMLKIADSNEKSRMIKEITKQFADQAKAAQMQATGQSHTINVLNLLIDESLRHTMDDQIQKVYGANNSYRPPEDMSYEVLAIDENADD